MSAKTALSALTQSSLASESSQLQMHIPDNPAKINDDANYFLVNLETADFKYLPFADNLVTSSDIGKEVGEFKVTVELSQFQGQDCFLVHANSHGIVDNVPCGTSITAYVNNKLETLEQQHHEYVNLENLPLDRKTVILKENDGYAVNKIIKQGEEEQRMARMFKLEHMEGFISEASNLLLQRLYVRKECTDTLQFVAFDSDTNLCTVTYSKLDERIQYVNDNEIIVYGVERTINSLSDLPTTWQSYFMKDGHLTSRVQVGSPVTMKVSVAPKSIEEDEILPKPKFEKKPLKWENDAEMYSKFLDRKEELKGDHAVYMRKHPELRALLADYMQYLLLRKPEEVLQFTTEYFASFSARSPPEPTPKSSRPVSTASDKKSTPKTSRPASTEQKA